jgi:hypothetical protein
MSDFANPRDAVRRYWLLEDDELAAMPEVSRHNEPQVDPQEYDCGCVTITRVTDRDTRRDERPFEMRLAIPCGTESCELRAKLTEVP